MIKIGKDLSRSVLIIMTTMIIPLLSYYMYTKEKHSEILIPFTDKNIRRTCLHSPLKESFSHCLQKKLGKMYSNSSLIIFPELNNLINTIYKKDLETLEKNNTKEIEDLNFNYIMNWSIAISYISNFEVARNDLSFIEILFIPYFKSQIATQVKEIQEKSKNLVNKDAIISKQILKRIQGLQFEN